MSSRTSRVPILLLLLLALNGAVARADPGGAGAPIVESTGAGPEVWLVSYGPGEIYWQRFGHNAIWVRDPALGLDHAFNFGFFDFGQEDFFLRFLQGRMLYFSAARPAAEEFASYIDENRSIRAQRLALGDDAAMDLTAYLLNEVRPENRDYLYDYYRNNCATRVRDALDMALGGALSGRYSGTPAAQSWRDHTRRLTADDFWLYLGLEIVLGARVDAPIDRWEEMFIPAVLADAVAESRLVLEDVMLYHSTLEPPPASPRAWWPRYLLAGLALAALAWLLTRRGPPGLPAALGRAWFGVAGLAGCALVFFWFGTDHRVAGLNLNLLVFNPIWLWPAFSGRAAGRMLPLVGGLSALALLMPFLPPWQYSFDVLGAFLPLNLAAAAAVDAARRRRAGR